MLTFIRPTIYSASLSLQPSSCGQGLVRLQAASLWTSTPSCAWKTLYPLRTPLYRRSFLCPHNPLPIDASSSEQQSPLPLTISQEKLSRQAVTSQTKKTEPAELSLEGRECARL